MSEVTYLNKKFENAGVIKTGVLLGKEDINEPVVHQIIKAILAGRRQGTACTKNKALVSGGGKKPFKQKGTGRARQGSSRSPLMPGGGTIFGPTPRSYEQKVNKKMMNKAIQSVIADKLQAGKLTVVEKLDSNGKTSTLNKLLTDKKLFPTLIVTSNGESLVLRAAQNLKNAKALPVDAFSVYEAVKYENLLVEKEAFEKLLERMV